MSLKNLWDWLAKDILSYVVLIGISFTVVKMFKSQRIALMFLSIAVGVVLWLFLNNPSQIMDILTYPAKKIFGLE